MLIPYVTPVNQSIAQSCCKFLLKHIVQSIYNLLIIHVHIIWLHALYVLLCELIPAKQVNYILIYI